MTRKVYTPASGRSEANLIIIGQYVILFIINQFTSWDVIHIIYKKIVWHVTVYCINIKTL